MARGSRPSPDWGGLDRKGGQVGRSVDCFFRSKAEARGWGLEKWRVQMRTWMHTWSSVAGWPLGDCPLMGYRKGRARCVSGEAKAR